MHMQNAMLAAMELNSMLPVNQRPRYNRNREAFFHSDPDERNGREKRK
jgi:hypothetical protein